MHEVLSRLGSKLGNWNDARAKHSLRSEATRSYRLVDRIAGWLYVRPDRKRPNRKGRLRDQAGYTLVEVGLFVMVVLVGLGVLLYLT